MADASVLWIHSTVILMPSTLNSEGFMSFFTNKVINIREKMNQAVPKAVRPTSRMMSQEQGSQVLLIRPSGSARLKGHPIRGGDCGGVSGRES